MDTETKDWALFSETDFSEANQIHVDTRDFHCITDSEKFVVSDYKKLLNYKERFFFSMEEIKELINSLKNT